MNHELTRKSVSTQIEKGLNREYTFKISSGALDRDLDRIDISKIDLTAYRVNPIVLFAHDHTKPIARAPRIDRLGDSVVATAEFPEPGVSELSDQIRGLLDSGILKACSIGFRPTEPPRSNKEGGLDFGAIELLEFSIVAVGANPSALRLRSLEGAGAGTFAGLREATLRWLIRSWAREEIRKARP